MNITSKNTNGHYNFGLYNNKPAYQNMYKSIIYVFKDISFKRIKTGRIFNKKNSKDYKIIFVSNKQLLHMDCFDEIKNCVFDGKLGTRYSTNMSSGSYFFCLKKDGPNPIPKIKN